MSDIKKELRLTAVLDDAKLRTQIQQLRKEFSAGLNLSSSDLHGLEKTFEKIADQFSQKISKAISAMKAQEVKSGKDKLGIKTFEQEQDEQWRNTSSRLKKEESARLKSEKRIEMERKQSEDRLAQLRDKRLNDQIRNSQLDRSPVAALMRGMGMSQGSARGVAGGVSGAAETLKSMSGGLSAAGGGILGGLTAITQIRRTLAERQFREVEDASQGRFIEAIARRSGRSEFLPKAGGAIGGALGGMGLGAGIGSFLGPLGTLAGGAIGAIGGGIGGALGLSNMQGEMRVQQIQPLLRAFSEARSLTPNRLQAMRGGGLSSGRLNQIQGVGAARGFRPEESIQQLLQARGVLGNQAGGALLGGMQRMLNVTGTDIGTQAQGIETLTGAGGGTRAAGQQRMIDTLRKGVAAGLDSSKSGKFLSEVTQFVQENTGTGRMDVGAVSKNMAEFARGFAGGGDITDVQLRQARELQQVTRGESTATTGLAGIGNITGIQQAFQKSGQKLTPELMMGLMNMSSTATQGDIQEFLQKGGVSTEALTGMSKDIAAAKRNAGQAGANLIGGQLGGVILGKERGFTQEQEMGAERGMNAPGLSDEDLRRADKQFSQNEDQLQNTKEFVLTQKEAELAQKRVIEGFGVFELGITEANRSLGELANALTITKNRLLEMAANLKLSPSN